MSITLPSQPSTAEAIANEAVEFCLLAWNEAFNEHLARGKDDYSATRYAHKAFRQALPDLTGPEKIQAFIACVSRGVLKGAIEPQHASRLLYAAQVARQSLVSPSKPRSQSSAKKPVQAEIPEENEQAIA